MFTRKKIPLILSVDDHALHSVLFGRRGRELPLKGISDLSLEAGIIEDGKLRKKSSFKQKVKELFSRAKKGTLDGKKIILTLPDTIFVQRVIRLSSASPVHEDLFSRIAQAHFPREEVFFKRKHLLHDEQIFAPFCAASKESLNAYLEALSELGAETQAVIPHASARFHSLYQDQHIAEPVIFMHFGFEKTDFVLADHFGIHQTFSVQTGKKRFISRLAQQWNASPAQAEIMLHRLGFRSLNSKLPYQKQLLNLAAPLQKAVSDLKLYYHHITQGDEPVLLLLAQGKEIPEFANWLSRESRLHLRPPSFYLGHHDPEEQHEYLHALGAGMHAVQKSALPYFGKGDLS